MIDSLTKLTKNVTFLIATLATGVSSLLFFIEEYRFELGQYDVLIGVSLFFILLTVAVVAHFKTNAKICKLKDEVTGTMVGIKTDMDRSFSGINIALLKTEVYNFHKECVGKEALTEYEANHFYMLRDKAKYYGITDDDQVGHWLNEIGTKV